jgi:hypothetical protein
MPVEISDELLDSLRACLAAVSSATGIEVAEAV